MMQKNQPALRKKEAKGTKNEDEKEESTKWNWGGNSKKRGSCEKRTKKFHAKMSKKVFSRGDLVTARKGGGSRGGGGDCEKKGKKNRFNRTPPLKKRPKGS